MYLLCRCKEGKILALSKSREDVKPSIIFERNLNYDFSEANLIQIFDSVIVCAKFEGGRSDFMVGRDLSLHRLINI